MIRFNAQLIIAKGYRTPGAALRKCGANAATIRKLTTGHTIRLDLRVITRLCTLLNCTPNDILSYTSDSAHPLPENHALNQLIPKENINLLEEIRKLSKEKLEQIHQIIKSP